MAQAIISRRGGSGSGGGYAAVKFENYGDVQTVEKGTSTNLVVGRTAPAATTVGNYALFGGGRTASSEQTTVDAYSSSLIRVTATSLSKGRFLFDATTVGNYALFGGGQSDSGGRSYHDVVDAYDGNLARYTPTALSVGRCNLASTTVGNYAIFGGGMNTTYSISPVDAYSSNLTRSTPTELSVARSYLTAATVGEYALFGGGICSPDIVSTVDAYNKNLTRNTPTGLSVARGEFTATTVGNYALFGGGAASRNYYAIVDAYDGNLTRSTPTVLISARRDLASTSIGNYALFGGGYYYDYSNSSSTYFPTVDCYDSNLTRSVLTGLDVARSHLAATTAGSYALFGGGTGNGYNPEVDVYEIENLVLQATVYKGSKYKFQNMTEEATVTSIAETISIPTPATGYIKFKNTTIS